MSEFIQNQLKETLGQDITSFQLVNAGPSTQCYQATDTNNKSYFVKTGAHSPLQAEAAGLKALTQYFKRVPRVHHCSPNFLITDYILVGQSQPSYWQNLGEQLALMHQQTGPGFGGHQDNWIGAAEQVNTSSAAIPWGNFFWECRLNYKLEQLHQKQGISLEAKDCQSLQQICQEQLNHEGLFPSPLHGDLWNGNVLCDTLGEAWLIDPAFYYGDRETDLAMTECFGGFPPEFYQAYNKVFPLSAGYESRKHIYNLYHLLNHWVIFGSSYEAAVRGLVKRLVG